MTPAAMGQRPRPPGRSTTAGSAPDAEVHSEATQCEREIARRLEPLTARSFSRQRWMTLASAGGIAPMVPVRTGGSCLRIALSVSTDVVALEMRARPAHHLVQHRARG